MIKEDKNKLKLKSKSKILVLGLIMLVVVGLFTPLVPASASTENPKEICNEDNSNAPCVPEFCFDPEGVLFRSGISKETCLTPERVAAGYHWGTKEEYGNKEGDDGFPDGGGDSVPGEKGTQKSALERNLDKSCDFTKSVTLPGCIEQIFYWLFFSIPSFLLYQSANLFNFMIDLALNNQMISGSKFIGPAWEVVRDISNIFFILILLYVAVKMILDMGGHDTKKIIARVVITALLINFSMFFAKVVIDSSNILALVFYNKLTVTTTESIDGGEAHLKPYTSVSGRETEKDLSGAMVAKFDASKMLGDDFFKKIKNQIVVVQTFEHPGKGWLLLGVPGVVAGYGNALKNYYFPQEVIPPAIMISIILISGAIMLFAAWCFFVAAFAFLMRVIELWVLIIFSPFAFMSFSIPLLAHTEYIGWDAWSKRLLKVSFMAPSYMFFMYFIFKLIQANIFKDMLPESGSRVLAAEILTILLPAMFILILLKRATKFAQEAAGKIAEVGIMAAKVAGGLALGAATGGTALLGETAVGGL